MSTNTNRNDNQLLNALKKATTSDAASCALYANRVMQTERVTIISDDGTTFEKDVSFLINWDSISEILGLVRNRAGL